MNHQSDFVQRWRDVHGYDAGREVLRDAAHEMIRDGGLEELNMRALAARVGLSAMAAYRYYPSKEALLEDVRAQTRRDFGAQLEGAAATATDPWEQFRAMCGAYLDYALANEQDYRVMFGAEVPTTAAGNKVAKAAPAWQVLVRVLERFPGYEGKVDVIDQAHLVWSTLHGLTMLHLAGRLNLDRSAPRLRQPMVDFLVRALQTA